MTWQRGNKVADGIKVASELTLRWGDYPGLAGGPNIITRVLKSLRGWQKRENNKDDSMHRTWPVIAGCKMGHQALKVNVKDFQFTQLSFFFLGDQSSGPPGHSMGFTGLLRHASGQGD